MDERNFVSYYIIIDSFIININEHLLQSNNTTTRAVQSSNLKLYTNLYINLSPITKNLLCLSQSNYCWPRELTGKKDKLLDANQL